MRVDVSSPTPGIVLGERRGVTGAAMWPFLVFLALAALLLAATWPHIAAMNYEWGDFASNSVLVQRAKAFRLLHGNYSRVGFYHPGPAILYVLAAGEALFHDLLGLTSPIGGQRVAVIFYTSAWVSVTAAMLARLLGAVASGLIAAAVLIGATLYYLPEALTGLWFPDLYYFPFVAFSAALALAVRGDVRHLPVLALSMGVLVNGHVSFAAITIVMIAFGLAANGLLGRIGVIPGDDSWWSMGFVARHGRRIAGSVALGALFLVPLLIDTVIHYPGQVPAYLAYKSGHAGNGLGESLRFALSYFGPAPLAAAVVGAALILAFWTRGFGLRSGGAAGGGAAGRRGGRAPSPPGRGYRRRHAAVAEFEATAEEQDVGVPGDVPVPPPRVGACREQTHNEGCLPALCGSAAAVRPCGAGLPTVGRIAEHHPGPPLPQPVVRLGELG